MASLSDLLFAISSPGGGKVAMVLGAGCSVEAPSSIPVARVCSRRIHDRLVADKVLDVGDCANPEDLSELAETVYKKTKGQSELVLRLLDEYNLKLTKANDGYLTTAALLLEGALASVVTLNFDLALSNALTNLDARGAVGVVERPADLLTSQKARNVYYLHRNANEPDADLWVLRASALEKEWKDAWEEVVATKVLSAPHVVFIGLGSAVEVLLQSVQYLRDAVTGGSLVFQVDRVKRSDSSFADRLNPDAYVQSSWGEFMRTLADRLVKEHQFKLQRAIAQKTVDDQLAHENTEGLVSRLFSLGLVGAGGIRAEWLLDERSYVPEAAYDAALIGDVVLGIAMMERISGTTASVSADGVVEFWRDNRIAATMLVASGRGSAGRAAIEARVNVRSSRLAGRTVPPRTAVVYATSDSWGVLTPPPSIVGGAPDPDDILGGTSVTSLVHISEMRSNAARVHEVIP